MATQHRESGIRVMKEAITKGLPRRKPFCSEVFRSAILLSLGFWFSIPLPAQVPKTFWGLTANTPSVPFPTIPFGYARIQGGVNAFWSNNQVACALPLSLPTNYNFTQLNSRIATQRANGITQIEIEISYTPNCVNGVVTDTCTPEGANQPKGYCYIPTDLTSAGSAYLEAYLTALNLDLATNFPGFTGFYYAGWNEWNAGVGSYQPGTGATGIKYLAWMQQNICHYAHIAGYQCSTPNTADMENPANATLLGNYVAEEIALYSSVISDTVNYHLYTNAKPGYNVPETAATMVSNATAAIIAAGMATPVMRSSEGSWLSSLWTNWSATVAYQKSQQVFETGNYYVCILGNTNHAPPNATYWTATSATDPDLSAAYLGRYFLSIVNTAGLQAAMWFSYNLNDGQLYPSGGPPTLAATAYQTIATLTTGMTFTNSPGCAVSGTVWTCPGHFASGQATMWVWDTNNYCANGTCTSTNYTVTAGAWANSISITNTSTAISPSATTVAVGIKPILLEANEAPTLRSIAPDSGNQGATVPVTLTGTNFITGASVAVSGAGVTVSGVTVVNSTTITATFTIAGGAAATARNVTVTTGGGTSGAATFTVEALLVPTLGSITPNNGNKGNTVAVTLTGTNFITGASITISGSGVSSNTVVVVSTTSITANFVIASGATPGAYTVTVTTLTGTSGAQVFTVATPAIPGRSRIVGWTRKN